MRIGGTADRSIVIETLLECLPARTSADISIELVPAYAMSMQTGLDADSYLVDCDGARYFLKLHHGELPAAPEPGLAAEAARRASDAGIGPAVLAHLPGRAATLFERPPANWRTVKRPDFDDAEVRHQAMTTLKHWHGTPSLPTTRPVWHFFDATFEALDGYIESARPASHLAAPEDYAQLRASYLSQLAIISTPPATTVPLHGEILASNMLMGPDKTLMLVDYDRVANGDPLWDLAALALAFDTPDIAHADLLAEYSSSSAGGDAVARLRANMVVQDIGWGLWGRLAHFVSTRDSIEFFKYGETRLARARGRLAAQKGAQQ